MSDDDGSAEGNIYRSLFYTSSTCTSSSDGRSDDEEDDEEDKKCIHISSNMNLPLNDDSSENTDEAKKEEEKGIAAQQIHIQTLMENIQIAEKTLPGIADRIWPAAEYLAHFILMFVKNQGCIDSISTITSSTLPPLSNEKSKIARQHVLDSLRNIFHREINNGTKNDHSTQESDDYDDFIIPTIELGAGVGLTGIKLATELRMKCILTDLECAIDLLNKNIILNAHQFLLGTDAVQASRLVWGTNDWKSCLDHLLATQQQQQQQQQQEDEETYQYDSKKNLQNHHQQTPLLIIASDCVYYGELHDPLEDTISSLLQSSPPGSVCLIAGVRRWKRDNVFYSKLGKRSRTSTHELQVVKLYETVDRKVEGKKDVTSIYGIQWVER